MTDKKQGNKNSIWSRKPSDRIFLVFLILAGCICLTVVDGWHYYTDPLVEGGTKLLARIGIELPQKDKPEEKDGLKAEIEKDDSKWYEQKLEWFFDDMDSLAASRAVAVNRPKPEPEPEPEPEQEIVPVPDVEPEPEPELEPEPEGVIFQTVGDDYFNDAVFIGDSRTVGMYEYSSLKETSTFYASVGLSVHKLFTAKIVEVPGQHNKITVEQALGERQFAKVYFMLGINEMGTGTPESFLEKYQECVNRIRELQPDAIIYLQGIMQVSSNRSAKGDYITNEGIALRNEGIKAMADGETIFYLEINEAVCDETGAMVAEYTHDGVHLKAQYIDLWKEYLKNHAVVRE